MTCNKMQKAGNSMPFMPGTQTIVSVLPLNVQGQHYGSQAAREQHDEPHEVGCHARPVAFTDLGLDRNGQ